MRYPSRIAYAVEAEALRTDVSEQITGLNQLVFLLFATATYLVLVEIVKRKLIGKLLRDGSAQGGAAWGITKLARTASPGNGAEGTTEQLPNASSEKNETVARK